MEGEKKGDTREASDSFRALVAIYLSSETVFFFFFLIGILHGMIYTLLIVAFKFLTAQIL